MLKTLLVVHHKPKLVQVEKLGLVIGNGGRPKVDFQILQK